MLFFVVDILVFGLFFKFGGNGKNVNNLYLLCFEKLIIVVGVE